MDITTITTFIQTLGFPIACCVVMGLFIYKMWEKINNTLDSLTETNEQLVITNQSLITQMDLKISIIDDKINNLADKIK